MDWTPKSWPRRFGVGCKLRVAIGQQWSALEEVTREPIDTNNLCGLSGIGGGGQEVNYDFLGHISGAEEKWYNSGTELYTHLCVLQVSFPFTPRCKRHPREGHTRSGGCTFGWEWSSLRLQPHFTIQLHPNRITRMLKYGMHTHTHTHTHVHVSTHTHVHTYTPTHLHTYTRTHIHTYTPTHVYTYTHTHVHMYTRTHVHTYTCTHVHMYTHTYTHTHIHTYTHAHIHTDTHTYAHTHTHTYTHTHTFARTHIRAHTHTHTAIYTQLAWISVCSGAPLVRKGTQKGDKGPSAVGLSSLRKVVF